MKLYYSTEQELHDETRALINFDVQSLLQVVAADRSSEPEMWLVEPKGYEKDGHPLRDSEATRLIAYSIEPRTVYATDGCNSCRRTLERPLDVYSPEELLSVAENTQLPPALLEQVAQLLRQRD